MADEFIDPGQVKPIADDFIDAGSVQPLELGTSPERPSPESPLDIWQRAAFGYAREPQLQQKFLESQFGKDNVKFTQEEDKGFFSIKDQDGVWKEADPGFEWSNLLTGKGLKEAAKDIVQEGAQYGARIMGATAGASVGATLGATLGSAIPIVGTVAGGALGGVIGAGAGSSAGEGVDIASRKYFDPQYDIAPEQEDVSKRLQAAFLLGATGEVGGKLLSGALNLGLRATDATISGAKTLIKEGPKQFYNDVVDGVTNVFKGLRDDASRDTYAHMVSGVSGLEYPESRALVENPGLTNKVMKASIDDRIRGGQKSVPLLKERTATKFLDDSEASYKGVKSIYDNIQKVASTYQKAPNLETSKAVLEDLYSKNFINRNAYTIDPKSKDVFARTLDSQDAEAVKFIATSARRLHQRSIIGVPVGYKDYRNIQSDLSGFINRGIKNSDVYQSAITFRDYLKNEQFGILDSIPVSKAKPLIDFIADKPYGAEIADNVSSIGQLRANLDKTFGPARELMDKLGGLDATQSKFDTIINQLSRGKDTANTRAIESMSKLLGVENPAHTFETIQAAEKFANAPVFSKKSLIGRPIPRAPRLAVGAVNAINNAVPGGTKVFNPYLNETFKLARNLPPESRAQLLVDPDFLTAITRTLSTAVAGQIQLENQLDEAAKSQ